MEQQDLKGSFQYLIQTMTKKYKDVFHFGLHVLNIFGLLVIIYLFYWGYQQEIFTSEIALRNLLTSLGSKAPFGFIAIQIIQTVIPIIPGALTIPMGTMVFGAKFGFFLNFVSIMLGSVINFFLARKIGRPLVELLASDQQIDKYFGWLDNQRRFDKLFTFGMFFPLSPADFLCYLAGLSNISFKKYLLILSLGKPLTLFIYSYGMTEIIQLVFQFSGI